MDPWLNVVRGNTSLHLKTFFQVGRQPTVESMMEMRLLVSRSSIHQSGQIIQAERQPNIFRFLLPLSGLFPYQSRRLQIEYMLSHADHPHHSDIDFWTEKISSNVFDAVNILVRENYSGFLMVIDLNIFTTARPYWWSIFEHAQMVDEVLVQDEGFGEDEPSINERLIKALETKIYQEDRKDGSTCAICLEDFKVGVELTVMPCSHKFHQSCATKWLERSLNCPLCRHAMQMVDGESLIA